jgi:hypothetical protein
MSRDVISTSPQSWQLALMVAMCRLLGGGSLLAQEHRLDADDP